MRFRRGWSTLVNVGPQLKFLAEKLDSGPVPLPPPPGAERPCDGKGQVGEERSGRSPHGSLLPAPPPEQGPRPAHLAAHLPAPPARLEGRAASPLRLLGVLGGAWRLPGPRRCFWSPTDLKARLGCGEPAGGGRLSGSPTELQARSGPPTSDQKPRRRYPVARGHGKLPQGRVRRRTPRPLVLYLTLFTLL